MSSQQFPLLLLFSSASAFLGGLLGTRLFLPTSVHAEPLKVVEAQEFRLVEKDGKPAGRFQIDRDGRPGVFLYDKHGEVRAVLGVLANGSPHLALSDRTGDVRVTLAVFSDERSGLFLVDAQRTPRLQLAVRPDGQPSLLVSDRDAKARAVVGVPASDLPGTWSESSMALFDGTGKVLWSAP